MIRPDRIGHVVIKVRDLEVSKKFYTEVLGLELMSQGATLKMAFLASNRRDHHELGLMEVGADAAMPKDRASLGLVHIAFRLRDEEELRAAYRDLKEKQVRILFTVNHGVARSIYFLDPDGYQLELYRDATPQEIAAMEDPYMGMERLDFAPEYPSLGDMVGRMNAAART